MAPHREPLARGEEAQSFVSAAETDRFFAADGRLTDLGVQTWVAHGLLAFTPQDISRDTPAAIVAGLAQRSPGAPGSNVDSFQGHGKRFAEALDEGVERHVDAVLASAFVAGAIESLVGPGAQRSPFKGCVRSVPGVIDQSWHKDQMGFEGDFGRRNHRPRTNVLCFYYPNDVTVEMGPTASVLGAQFLCGPADHRRLSAGGRRGAAHSEQARAAWDGPTDRMGAEPVLCPDNMVEPWLFGDACGTPQQMTYPAGTFCILHPDTWHRATASTGGDAQRFMLRFHYQRTVEPTGPSWQHAGDRSWRLGVPRGLPDLTPVWLASWRWLLGVMAEPLATELALGGRDDPNARVLCTVSRHITGQPPPASSTTVSHAATNATSVTVDDWMEGDTLPPEVVEQLTWCDWEVIQSEVWCCHVNWECCGHWRASPFHIAQRKLQQPKRLEGAQDTGPRGVLHNAAGVDDPRRSLARQVPALRYAYTLAAQGRVDVLCEALLFADSTAIPVAQALASAPRPSVGSIGQDVRFKLVLRRLISHLEAGYDRERATEDCAFVLGELSLRLRPAEVADDRALLIRAIRALCSRAVILPAGTAAGDTGSDMLRGDGSPKSARGYLGPIENVCGGTMSELSIGVPTPYNTCAIFVCRICMKISMYIMIVYILYGAGRD